MKKIIELFQSAYIYLMEMLGYGPERENDAGKTRLSDEFLNELLSTRPQNDAPFKIISGKPPMGTCGVCEILHEQCGRQDWNARS